MLKALHRIECGDRAIEPGSVFSPDGMNTARLVAIGAAEVIIDPPPEVAEEVPFLIVPPVVPPASKRRR